MKDKIIQYSNTLRRCGDNKFHDGSKFFRFLTIQAPLFSYIELNKESLKSNIRIKS